MPKSFGQFIRKIRLDKKLTLRQFCKESNYDIGYISRLENEIISPPVEEKKLEKLAKSYNISKKSENWKKLKNLSDISKRKIPEEIDTKVLNYLPEFFRKASKKEVTKKDIEKLVKLIKGE